MKKTVGTIVIVAVISIGALAGVNFSKTDQAQTIGVGGVSTAANYDPGRGGGGS